MRKLLLLVTIIVLAGCASELSMEGTPKGDYAKARRMLEEGKYEKANRFLEKFASHHPYSHFTVQAELLRAFAAYKNGEHILSETLCKEFVRRHPRHPDVAYAKYLLAMSHYKQVSPSAKDQSATKAAIKAFKQLLSEHPGSNYAKDGIGRLQRLYNLLARHELNVGKFYFDRERFVAAANRFQTVLRDYQTSPAIEEALYYLAASYAALDLPDDARAAARLLHHNYPNSSWSRKAARFL